MKNISGEFCFVPSAGIIYTNKIKSARIFMTHTRIIQFAGNAIQLTTDSTELLEAVDVHFAHCLGEEKNITAQYQVEVRDEAKFVILKDGAEFASNLNIEQVLFQLMQDGLTMLNGASKTHLIFHAGGLAYHERGLLLCGKSGSGKSTLTAWLTANGFQYLSDEVIGLPLIGEDVQGFCRSLVLKRGSEMVWKQWQPAQTNHKFIKMNDGSAWFAPTLLNDQAVRASAKAHLVLFPTFSADAELQVETLSTSNTLFMLMQCLVNARNFEDYGMKTTKEFAQKISAYKITYSNIEQAAEWIRKTITA